MSAAPVGEGLLRLLGPVPCGESREFEPGEYVEYDDAILGFPMGAIAGILVAVRLRIFYPPACFVSALLGAIPFSAAPPSLNRIFRPPINRDGRSALLVLGDLDCGSRSDGPAARRCN